MRKVEPGAADRSYGIEVAKLAGLPDEVVKRAREVLTEHEVAEQQATAHLSPGRNAPANAVDDLYSAVATGAGKVARGGLESADAA